MNLFALSGLLIGIACTAMAGLVYLTNRRSLVNQLWAIFCMAVAVWGFGGLLVGLTDEPQAAFIWWRIAHIGVILIPALFYHFVTVFLELRRPRNLTLIYLVGLGFLFADATPLFIAHMRKVFGQFYYDSPPGPLYPSFFAFFLGTVLWSHLDLWKFLWRTKQGLRRVQVQWFFLATVVGFAGGTTCFLPVFGIDLYPYGNFTVPLYPVLMTYAILRYRLMDVNLAIARGAVFLFIYSFVVGLPFFIGAQFQDLWQSALGMWWWVGPVVLMGILASLGPFVYLWIQQKAEAHLLKEQRRYQRTLMNAAKGMTRIRDLQHLLELIVHMLTRSMKLTHAGVFLQEEPTGQYVLHASRDRDVLTPGLVMAADDPLIQWLKDKQAPLVSEEIRQLANGQATPPKLEDSLRRIEASVVIPSFADDKLGGFLTLGDKKSGQMYSQDDLNVLQTLANQAALAVQNARFYEELQTKTAELIHTSRLTSMGKMASGIAHQMRNRFACLMGEADLAQALLQQLSPSTAPQKQQETVQTVAKKLTSICEEGQKGLQIVKNLLEYSKPAANRQLISLREVVDRGLAQLSIKHDLSQFALYLNVSQEHPYVYVNPSEWQDVFFNLLDNAAYWVRAKASLVAHGHLTVPPGELPFGPKIAITATPSDDHATLLIRVSDNGLGIEAKEQDKLFLPFFTLKGSSEEKTGIGLYFVWIIVKAHGGIIRLERSAYGHGTTFLIELPIPEGERQWLASSS